MKTTITFEVSEGFVVEVQTHRDDKGGFASQSKRRMDRKADLLRQIDGQLGEAKSRVDAIAAKRAQIAALAETPAPAPAPAK